MVGCLGLPLVRTAEHGRESRLYSSREAGGKGGLRGARTSISLLLPLPPALAELLAVALGWR